MIDALRLFAKSSGGRRGVMWCVIALGPAVAALSLALSIQSALDQQAFIRYQRDSAQGANTAELSRQSFSRPVSGTDGRPSQIVTIASDAGVRLDWPGFDVTPAPGTTFVSRSVASLNPTDLAALTNGGRIEVLNDGLESYPGEFVVLRFVSTDRAPTGSNALLPGFNSQPPNDSIGRSLRLVAAAAVLLPAFALARAAAALFVSRNRDTIAMIRLFGVTRRSTAGAIALLVAGSSIVATLFASGLLATIRRTSLAVRIDSTAVFARQLDLSPATLVMIAAIVSVVTLVAALVGSMRLIDDPLRSIKGLDSRSSRTPVAAAGAVALVVGAAVWYARIRDDIPEALAILAILAIVLVAAVAASRLALELSAVLSVVVNRGPIGGLISAVTGRLATEFRVLLAPLGWGALLAGLVVGILPAVAAPAPESDLTFVLASSEDVLNMNEIMSIDGVAAAAHLRTTSANLAGSNSWSAAVVDCASLTAYWGEELQSIECDQPVALVPRELCEACGRTGPAVTVAALGSGSLVGQAYDPPAGLETTIVVPSQVTEGQFTGSRLLVRLDWSVPPAEVISSIRDSAQVAIVESPRSRLVTDEFEFARVRASLLIALATGLSLTAVAYVAGVATVVSRLRPRFASLRLFGVRRVTCMWGGTRAVLGPLAFVVAIPLVLGVGLAQALRDDSLTARFVSPGWQLTGGAISAVLLVLVVVVSPLGQLEAISRRDIE